MNDDIDIRLDDLPPPTLPAVSFALIGFENEALAKQVANVVSQYLSLFSRYIDAERLDGVTIAYDYDAALRNLDRGRDGMEPLTRSTELVDGVAMTPAVVRDGVVKAHMVLSAGIVLPLLDEKSEYFHTSLYTIVHELGHVDGLKMKDIAMPGLVLGAALPPTVDSFWFTTALGAWDEYGACRLSATVYPAEVELHEESFLNVLTEAGPRVRATLRQAPFDNSWPAVFEAARKYYRMLVITASYLIGHLHGLDETMEQRAPTASSALAGSWFGPTFFELEKALAATWRPVNEWGGMRNFDELKEIIDRCFRAGGVRLTDISGGRIHVGPA